MNSIRTATSLNGTWTFVTDPEDRGRAAGWYATDATWPDRAHEVTVPHAWQEADRYRDYTGTAWYRRTFRAPDHEDSRVRLRFGAVDFETTIWVNGQRIGDHRGGYLPFECDIAPAISDGENTVVLAVTDPADLSEIPHGKQGPPWYQRVSGVWQDVTLETVPSTSISDVRVTPNLEDDSIRVELAVDAADDPSPDGTASIEVRKDGRTVEHASTSIDAGTGVTTIALDDPSYWSPDDPVLYTLRVELRQDGRAIDRVEEYFGMRSIDVRDGQLYLNGDPLVIRGALDQGYYPETLYRPFREELVEEEVRTAKDLGLNLIRKHLKPAHPAFLEAADRLGLLVWQEPANPTVYTDRSRRAVRDQLHGLIDRDYNRPSVVIWSLYNEEWGIGNAQGQATETSLWDDPEKQAYLADRYEEITDLDPTRLVCDNSGWAHVATDLNDYHRYFASPDRADALANDLDRIVDAPEDNYAAIETEPDAAPIVISEFGTWGMCDAPAIEAFYGGEPPWYSYDHLPPGLKRPEGYRERFESTGLADVFGRFEDFAGAWQRRQYGSIADAIERMRTREAIQGYVLTQFSDIEWEFNGLLDYRREPKVFHEEFPRVNDDVLVRIEPRTHAVWAGERVVADLVVVNDMGRPIDAEVDWALFGRSGTVPVAVRPHGTERIDDAVTVDAPEVDEIETGELAVAIDDVTANREPITIVPRPAGDPDTSIYVDEPALRSTFNGAGFELARDLNASVDVAVLSEPVDGANDYVDRGGTVLRVPTEDGSMLPDSFFEYRSLPEGASWNLAASFLYCRDGPIAAHTGSVPGWELEGAYPYHVVEDLDQADEVHVGYVEGWIANWGGAVAVRPSGDGRVGAFTIRVTDPAGGHPVATAALVDFVSSFGPG